MIRLSAIIGLPVVTTAGQRLGHVEEVHVGDEGAVTMFALGGRGWLEREASMGKPGLLAWERVQTIGTKRLTVTPAELVNQP